MRYALMSKPGPEDTYGFVAAIFTMYDVIDIEYVKYSNILMGRFQ